MNLSASAVRVLGCLMEKEMATPEYYPLSLNALVNACNQKTNRHPVVEYDEETVVRAISELKQQQLAWQSDAARVPKYGENLIGSKKFVAQEAALLCLLLVRGPQTVGELKGRSERMATFSSLEEVDETLQALADLSLVLKLPRQPGRKECRYAHLFSGEPVVEETYVTMAVPEAATVRVRAEEEQFAAFTEQLTELREELAGLRQQFETFRKQFE